VYRKAMAREDAFAELRRCAGGHFDPAVVDVLLSVLSARSESPALSA
jgi:HD-GYP domain-containing protein (c-di-GMP phosphodiesterase class II)